MASGLRKQRLDSARASAVSAPGVPFCTAKCWSRKKSGSNPIICSGNGAFWMRKNHHTYLVANSIDVSRYMRNVGTISMKQTLRTSDVQYVLGIQWGG